MAGEFKNKLQPTYPSWMLHKLNDAIKSETIEGHGTFKSIEWNSTAKGSRRVFRDLSNGQDYEVLVNVLSSPVDFVQEANSKSGWYKKSSISQDKPS